MPDTLTVPPPAPAAEEEPALYVCVWDHVARTVAWLDAANGRGPHETAVRVMKIAEETGEAVAAYIGLTGANPRKGVTATPDDLAGELCDVVLAALIALATVTGGTPQAESAAAPRTSPPARSGSGPCAPPPSHHPAARRPGRPIPNPRTGDRFTMSTGDTILTITGNLTGDPELRFTGTGTAVVAFTVAASRRVYDQATGQWQDGDTLFLRCSAWRELADHAAESLTKGTRVIVTGRLKQRSYETTEGEKRTVYEVDADDVGPSLKWATAKIAKTSRDKVPHPADGGDPWQAREPAAAAAGADGDRPPF